jgi:alpha/beta superfamily hydrolase
MPEVIFNGSDGRLEGRYVHGQGPAAPLALVLHPHPQHGGTMNNRIVHSMFHMFVRRGFSVLRFNFRGVGRSQGVFDHGQGELRDAAAALDWMLSFGAWIAMQLLMRRPEIQGFMCASLPANMYDFGFLAPCPSSGLIVHGERDMVTPTEAVTKLVNKLSQQRGIVIDFETIEGSDHFFNGFMSEVESLCEAYLDKRLKPGAEPRKLAFAR